MGYLVKIMTLKIETLGKWKYLILKFRRLNLFYVCIIYWS